MIIDVNKQNDSPQADPHPVSGYIMKSHPDAALVITHCVFSSNLDYGKSIFEIGPHTDRTMQTKVDGCVVFNVPAVFNDAVYFNSRCELNAGDDGDGSIARRTMSKNFSRSLQTNSTLIGELYRIREMLETHSMNEIRHTVNKVIENCRIVPPHANML